jgi:hypothetical protein
LTEYVDRVFESGLNLKNDKHKKNAMWKRESVPLKHWMNSGAHSWTQYEKERIQNPECP